MTALPTAAPHEPRAEPLRVLAAQISASIEIRTRRMFNAGQNNGRSNKDEGTGRTDEDDKGKEEKEENGEAQRSQQALERNNSGKPSSDEPAVGAFSIDDQHEVYVPPLRRARTPGTISENKASDVARAAGRAWAGRVFMKQFKVLVAAADELPSRIMEGNRHVMLGKGSIESLKKMNMQSKQFGGELLAGPQAPSEETNFFFSLGDITQEIQAILNSRGKPKLHFKISQYTIEFGCKLPARIAKLLGKDTAFLALLHESITTKCQPAYKLWADKIVEVQGFSKITDKVLTQFDADMDKIRDVILLDAETEFVRTINEKVNAYIKAKKYKVSEVQKFALGLGQLTLGIAALATAATPAAPATIIPALIGLGNTVLGLAKQVSMLHRDAEHVQQKLVEQIQTIAKSYFQREIEFKKARIVDNGETGASSNLNMVEKGSDKKPFSHVQLSESKQGKIQRNEMAEGFLSGLVGPFAEFVMISFRSLQELLDAHGNKIAALEIRLHQLAKVLPDLLQTQLDMQTSADRCEKAILQKTKSGNTADLEEDRRDLEEIKTKIGALIEHTNEVLTGLDALSVRIKLGKEFNTKAASLIIDMKQLVDVCGYAAFGSNLANFSLIVTSLASLAGGLPGTTPSQANPLGDMVDTYSALVTQVEEVARNKGKEWLDDKLSRDNSK